MSKSQTKTEKRPIGRPTKYTEPLILEMCVLLAEGKSLAEICERDDMPAQATVYRWLHEKEEFRENYARAREQQGETLFDGLLKLVNQKPPVLTDDKGNTRVDSGWVQWMRLVVDTHKWGASKLLPKKYGDKLDVQHAGGVNLVVVTGIPDDDQ